MKAKQKQKGMKKEKPEAAPLVKIEFEMGREEPMKKKRKTKDKNGSYE